MLHIKFERNFIELKKYLFNLFNKNERLTKWQSKKSKDIKLLLVGGQPFTAINYLESVRPRE